MLAKTHLTRNSTLGGGGGNTKDIILEHQLFVDIAKAHNCSTGVVSLSWAVQRGINVIPKIARPHRIEENINLVTLTDDEMMAINDVHKTVKFHRLAKDIKSQQMERDGKPTLQMWDFQEFGWEDEQGNCLT